MVTGGSGLIGRAIALGLAREGCGVCIASRGRAQLERVAMELTATVGQPVIWEQVDTADDASVRAAVDRVAARLGTIDVLVNCAGTPTRTSDDGRLGAVDDATLRADFDVKVFGYLRLARAIVPGMAERGWGRVVNVGGMSTFVSGSITGSARNAAITAMTKNLADEFGHAGIAATAVHPGRTVEAPDDERAVASGRGAAIGRLVSPEELADVVVFLASERSLPMNGESVACVGGQRGHIRY